MDFLIRYLSLNTFFTPCIRWLVAAVAAGEQQRGRNATRFPLPFTVRFYLFVLRRLLRL